MSKKLFVGNLSWGIDDAQLNEAFAKFGTVAEAIVIKDRATGRSKGFGFVTFDDDAEAEAAISGMNEVELDGRAVVVNEARPREER